MVEGRARHGWCDEQTVRQLVAVEPQPALDDRPVRTEGLDLRRLAEKQIVPELERIEGVATVHLFGIGFVTFALFGFAEHMLPRFIGAPIRGGWMAWTQQSLLHVGLVLMVLQAITGARSLALPGGVLALAALAAFGVRLWPVLTWDGRGVQDRQSRDAARS